jgi:hypothetical protein
VRRAFFPSVRRAGALCARRERCRCSHRLYDAHKAPRTAVFSRRTPEGLAPVRHIPRLRMARLRGVPVTRHAAAGLDPWPVPGSCAQAAPSSAVLDSRRFRLPAGIGTIRIGAVHGDASASEARNPGPRAPFFAARDRRDQGAPLTLDRRRRALKLGPKAPPPAPTKSQYRTAWAGVDKFGSIPRERAPRSGALPRRMERAAPAAQSGVT